MHLRVYCVKELFVDYSLILYCHDMFLLCEIHNLKWSDQKYL